MTLQTSPATCWVLVNLLHASTCAAWAAGWRRQRPGASVDETLFLGTVLWLGSLSSVLHGLAALGQLSLWSAMPCLLALDAMLCAWLARSRASRPERAPQAQSDVAETRLAWIGAAVLAAVAAQWIAGDFATGSISGTDAAHYHVPHAINFALGASLFDPPATGHLYPMGASVVASWFLLPLGNGLLVDSAALPWFILLAASLCWLFRQATDSSGLAVVPWFLLLLLQLPIVRISVPFSADLPFAAAFIALFANVLSFARGITIARLVTCSLVIGLLLGTKATGLPAAALLASCAIGPLVVAHRHQALQWPRSWWRALAVALACGVLVVTTGGIWQIVNWRNYGSPIAPLGVHIGGITVFPGPDDYLRGYVSVSRDLRQDGALRTWRFARRYLHDWAGPFLLLQWFVPLTLLDAAVALRRGNAPEAALVRIMLVVSGVFSTAVLCWLLVDAPWTSLRWTSGLSLRYVLPLIALGTFVPLLAVFPLSTPWHRGRYRYAGVLILAVAAIAFTLAWDRPPEQDAGRHLLNFRAGPVAAAIAAIAALAAATTWRMRTSLAVAVVAGLMIVVGLVGGRSIDLRGRALTAQAMARRSATPGKATPSEAISALISGDAGERRDASLRRVFVAARFDTPLDLQGPVFNALVYDTRDPVVVQRLLRGSEPGTGSSDYLIGSLADLQTTRGSPMVAYCARIATLVPLGDAGPYRVWRVSPPSGPTSAH